MRRFLMMMAAAALTLAGQSALAGPRPDGPPPECRQQDRNCPPQARQGKAGQRGDRPAAPPARHQGDDRRGEGRRDARQDGPRDLRRDPPPQQRPDEHRRARHDGRPVPHVGENARAGRLWTPPRDSRLAKAPHGQEHRVIGDHLVLVDRKSHRILSLVAPVRLR